MGRALGNLVWTAIVSLVVIAIGTIFRLEIEDFWNGQAQPYIEAHIGRWAAVVLEYVPTFGGGVIATILILLAVDRIRARLGKHAPIHQVQAPEPGQFPAKSIPEVTSAHRRALPTAETEAISESALRVSLWLQKRLPPLAKRAWEINTNWENKRLTYETKTEFSNDLSSLSRAIYDELWTSQRELINSDPRYRDGLNFAFDYASERHEFKQAVDLYQNAVRQLVEGQSAEILRLYNDNLVRTLGRLEAKANHIIRVLGLIGNDPSQYYGADPNRL